MFQAPNRKVNRVFLHCSASEIDLTEDQLIREITQWHLKRGFSDIGYHYVVDKPGNVMRGRSLELTPAAQQGNNTATVAICAHGLRFSSNWYESSQADALRDLCSQINLAYSGVIAFWPHNAVSNKACPVFDVTKLLELDRWRRMP